MYGKIISEWPEVDDRNLFSYILRVKAVDVDYIGVYKDQKAYSYWMSGFVDAVCVAKCPVNSKFTFLKRSVCPYQRIRDDPHEVWICTEGAKKDCKILTLWCTCTAGTGEACNHVIAVLYKVNYAFKKNYGTDDGLPQSLSTKALDFMSSCSVKNKPLEQVAPLLLEYCQLTNEQTMRIVKETRGQHSNSVAGAKKRPGNSFKFPSGIY